MKLAYYVNDTAQPNGDHEVHTSKCKYFDKIQFKSYLGSFDNCADAVKEAKKKHSKSNGCYWCSNE
ncbi:hypothetical protein K6102_07390, partial [Vibrio furnissii]|uniref:hypothetical protein n=1 Tax=Vibrio furnissii TaxID=29494 RepID=UPI001EEBF437